jgi:hypothetical protein
MFHSSPRGILRIFCRQSGLILSAQIMTLRNKIIRRKNKKYSRISCSVTLMFLAYFPCFEVTKVDLCNRHAVCVSLYPPSTTSECLNQSL